MLTFHADGELGHMDARVFLDVVGEFLTTAREIDRTVTSTKTASRWRLADLETGSAGFVAVADAGPELEDRVYREFQIVTREPAADTVISTARIRALIKVRRRAEAGDLGLVTLRNGRADVVPIDDSAVANMEARLASMVQSIGSVTGVVERLSVPGKGDWYVTVRDRRSGRPVTCLLPRGDQELLGAARPVVGLVAVVRGRVARLGVRGAVQEVRQVSSIEPVPTEGDITMGFGRGPSSHGDVIWEQRG